MQEERESIKESFEENLGVVKDLLKEKRNYKSNKEVYDDAFLFGKTAGWWVEFVMYTIASLILILILALGINSWYYHVFINNLSRSGYVWASLPEFINRFIHYRFISAPPDIPFGTIINGMTFINLILGGVEIGYGVIVSKEIEIGKMKSLPFKQRYRLFKLMLVWTILAVTATLVKYYLDIGNLVDFHLSEIFFGWSTSTGIFAAGMKILKGTNVALKGDLDKANQKLEKAAIEKELEEEIDEINKF